MLIEAPTDDCVGQPNKDKSTTPRKERKAGTTKTAFPECTMRWILVRLYHGGKKCQNRESVLNSFLIPKGKYTFVLEILCNFSFDPRFNQQVSNRNMHDKLVHIN